MFPYWLFEDKKETKEYQKVDTEYE